MQLGLEGWTDEEITQEKADRQLEYEHWQSELAKRQRWMQRDHPFRTFVYAIGRFFGCGYEAAHEDGWHDGVSEGRNQVKRELASTQ